jgi:hypothetical protein
MYQYGETVIRPTREDGSVVLFSTPLTLFNRRFATARENSALFLLSQFLNGGLFLPFLAKHLQGTALDKKVEQVLLEVN